MLPVLCYFRYVCVVLCLFVACLLLMLFCYVFVVVCFACLWCARLLLLCWLFVLVVFPGLKNVCPVVV